MEEKKSEQRSFEQVQAEYGQICSRLGHAEYQRHVLEGEIRMLKETLQSLNFEAAKVKASESKPEESK